MMNKQTEQRLVSFRQEVHENPEPSFQEFETRNRIRKILNEFGVKDACMKEMAKTGLIVDIAGKAPAEGKNVCIAFRADTDALTMVENNHHLSYRSKNEGVAHMCGHDGHITCLVAFVPLYMKRLSQVPKNKVIRLLFQPSEEGPLSGAKLMIEEGCLDGVDEVYGCHQWPTAPLGQLWCKQGPVMSEATVVKFKIIGDEGHGSQPENLKVSIWQGLWLYKQIKDYIEELRKTKSDVLVSTFPVFQAGERYNVISSSCSIEGTIRSFQEGLKDTIRAKFQEFIEQIKAKGFEVEFSYTTYGPMNTNTQKEAEHVLRVGKKVFGKENAGKGKLPFRASEDFAYFTRKVPGAFYFLSTARDEPNPPMVHSSNFDFNDKLIPKAAQFWFELAVDRLGLQFD